MPDNNQHARSRTTERQEALTFLMENLRPRERKVLDLRFGLTGNGTHSLRQIGHLAASARSASARFRTAPGKAPRPAERVGWEPSLLLD